MISTIYIFMIAFFVILFTGCTGTGIELSVSGIICVLYLLCVGQRRVIQSSFFFLELRAVMVALAVYGVFRNRDSCVEKKRDVIEGEGSSGRRWKIKPAVQEIAALFLVLLLTMIPAFLITEQAARYAGRGFLSSLFSFGGGDAYLTVADGLFVNGSLVTEGEFYGNIVSVVNVLPGSVLCKTLSGIGYYVGYHGTGNIFGAFIVSLCVFVCSLAASCGVFSIVSCLYGKFEEMNIFRQVKLWIRPIVSDLMLTVILSLVYQSKKLGLSGDKGWIPVGIMFVVCLMDSCLYFWWKWKNGKVILLSAISALLMCNLSAVYFVTK